MIHVNSVSLVGTLLSNFIYHHEDDYHKYYISELKIDRLSGFSDILPILIREDRLMNSHRKYRRCRVDGQFRTYNNDNSIDIFIYVDNLLEDNTNRDYNSITFSGVICKEPVFKITPRGREVTELLVAIDRAYNKSSYINCICWSHLARVAQELYVGINIECTGRIQSRDYIKESINHRVYECALQSLILN